MDLSIVIPIYNEGLIIKKNIEKIHNYFFKKFKFEIIIVNDGSKDNSMKIIKNLNINNINIININRNSGKGNAIKRGILESNGKLVLITDADLSASIDQYDTLYNKYKEGNDIVIGSRSTKNSKIIIKQSVNRIIAGKIFNLLVKNILNLKFEDTQCGFKLFNGLAIRKLISHSIINRFCIDVEILFLAKKKNHKIYEVGINWKNDKLSSVNLFKDSIIMFFDLLRIKFKKYKL